MNKQIMFKKHLTAARKTYKEHFTFAFKAGVILSWAAFTSFVHAIVPSWFPFVSERIITDFYKQVEKNRQRRQRSHGNTNDLSNLQ